MTRNTDTPTLASSRGGMTSFGGNVSLRYATTASRFVMHILGSATACVDPRISRRPTSRYPTVAMVERARPSLPGDGSDPICPVCLGPIKPQDRVRGRRDEL